MTAPILKLRATKTPGEGFPLLGIAPDWFIETVGMRGSDVADAVIAIGGDDALIHLLARAPELAAALAAEKARADNAERMVAECVSLLADVKKAEWMSRREGLAPSPFWGEEWQVRIDAALSSTADVAGRWVPAGVAAGIAKRCDAAIAARDEAVREAQGACLAERRAAIADITRQAANALAAANTRWEHAERSRDEVGIQYAAAQAEIARLRAVVDAARDYVDGSAIDDGGMRRAIRALDSVPGDALAPAPVKVQTPDLGIPVEHRFSIDVLNTDIATVIADALVEAYGQLVEVDLVEGGCSLSGSEVAHVEAATRVLGDAVEKVRAAGFVEVQR